MDEPWVRSTGGRNQSFAHEGVPSTVPAESIPIWVDRDADECSVSSESCWGEQEDLIGEEVPEWGVLPCSAPARPPQEDCNTRAAVHHRLPSRRLVLVGGGSLSQNRFSLLGHEHVVRATPQLRVMLGEDIPTPTVSGVDPHRIGESDTDFVDGQSDRDPDAVEDVEISPEENISVSIPPGRVSLGMSSLDEVQLDMIFERRAHVMRSIPHVLKGFCFAAVRMALREATVGRTTGDMLRLTRVWKLFLLLPRMWLSRPRRGGLVPKGRLLERVSLFHNGHWSELVERSVLDSESPHHAACRKRRRSKSGIEQRHEPRLYVCQAPNAFICVSSVAPPKHQMRLYVCHQMRLYVCHQMRLYVCHQMRLLTQRSSFRSLTFARFARTFFNSLN